MTCRRKRNRNARQLSNSSWGERNGLTRTSSLQIKNRHTSEILLLAVLLAL